MELRHLRYFVAVAEELHFGRAAIRLHIAQPPLSQQIKVLEQELGAQLFHRTRRRVELTDAGRIFLEEARATLSQAARAEEAVRSVAAGKRGRLAIGFVMSAAYTVLPDAVRSFRKSHGDVDLTLCELPPATMLDAMARRELDVALLRPPIECPEFESDVILREPLMLAIPSNHHLAKAKTVPVTALRSEPLVLFPRKHGPGLFDAVTELCLDAGFTPEPAYEPNDMQSTLAHVACGLGIAVVPGSLAGFRAKDIAYRRLRGRGRCLELACFWPRNRPSPLRDALVTELRRAGDACVGRLTRSLGGRLVA